MSVAYLTSGTKVPVVLQPNVTFNNLRGGTLTLGELYVQDLHVKTIFAGDDSLPDVYYFGQVKPTSVCNVKSSGTGGSPGPWTPNSGGVGTAYPSAGQLTLFPEPLYYNSAGTNADPLNPYIGCSVSASPVVGRVAPDGTYYSFWPTNTSTSDVGSMVGWSIPHIPGTAGVASAAACDGCWFGTFTTDATTAEHYGITGGPRLVYYVQGSPVSSPPDPWGAFTVTKAAGATIGQRYTIATSGIVGSCVQFPTTSTPSTLLGGGGTSGSGSVVNAVYPVNVNTPSTALQPYGGTFNGLSGAYYGANATTGIWIQQIWWVTNPQNFPGGVVPSYCYNVTHLFTWAGASTSSVAATTPINSVNTLSVSQRAAPAAGQTTLDGNFTITVDMPTTVYTTTGGATPGGVAGYTFSGAATGGTPPVLGINGTFTTPNQGNWVIYLATQSPACTPQACRASTNEVPNAGGAQLPGASTALAAGGTFSINPYSVGGVSQFPTLPSGTPLTYAGNLTLGYANNQFPPTTTGVTPANGQVAGLVLPG